MKLKHLHIENYGRFSDYDYDFKEGLNEFCEENGFGKTTLASFIKAMFYGLPSYRSNSKDFNDRAHFYPFNGGKFGGNLSFVTGGKEYKIERFFNEKSESADSLKVYCNGAPYTDFGGDIGLAVFKIDKEAFERTAFINSSDVDFGATGSISAKLNSSVDGLSGATFEGAVERLEQAKKRLKQVRGSNDKISETRRDIADLNDKISNAEAISRSLLDKYNELNVLNQKINSLEKQKEAALQAEKVQVQWRAYERYVTDAEECKGKLALINEAYPAGIPAKEEGEQLKIYSRELDKISSAGSAISFGAAKKERLNELKERFSCGVPTDAELDEVNAKNNSLLMAQSEIERLSKEDGGENFAALERKFSGGVPQDNVLAECDKKLSRMREIDNKLSARTEVPEIQKPKRKGGVVAGCAVGVLLIILGIVLGVFANLIAGIVVCAIGVIAAVVCAMLFITARNKQSAATQSESSFADLQSEKSNLTDELRAVIAPYGYYSDGGVQYDYHQFKTGLAQYLDLKQKIYESKRLLERKQAEAEELANGIEAFFAKYGITGAGFAKNNSNLIAYKKEYESLLAEEGAAEQRKKQAEENYSIYYKAYNDILNKYRISCSGDMTALADKIYTDAADKARLEKEAAELSFKAEDYKTKNNLTGSPQPQKADINELNGGLGDSRRRLAVLNREISDAEAEVENADGLKNALAEKEELLEVYKKRHALLEGTIKLLKTADQKLKDRYISPVKNAFLHYSDMIEKALGEKVVMDSNFNLYFERGGENRSDRHLSDGQRALCALCFRLALIDNMYEGEQPFIVMDDPFVNIDDGHIKKTASLVKELSEDKQIIYFCCHTSRSLA